MGKLVSDISFYLAFPVRNASQKNLQELANQIDFRILKDVQVPDMQGDSEVPVG